MAEIPEIRSTVSLGVAIFDDSSFRLAQFEWVSAWHRELVGRNAPIILPSMCQDCLKKAKYGKTWQNNLNLTLLYVIKLSWSLQLLTSWNALRHTTTVETYNYLLKASRPHINRYTRLVHQVLLGQLHPLRRRGATSQPPTRRVDQQSVPGNPKGFRLQRSASPHPPVTGTILEPPL